MKFSLCVIFAVLASVAVARVLPVHEVSLRRTLSQSQEPSSFIVPEGGRSRCRPEGKFVNLSLPYEYGISHRHCRYFSVRPLRRSSPTT